MMSTSPSAPGRQYKVAVGLDLGHVQNMELEWDSLVKRLAAAVAFSLMRIERATRVCAGDAAVWATTLSANSRPEMATIKGLQKIKASASEALPALKATDLCTALAAPRRRAGNDIVIRPAAGRFSPRLGGAA